MNAQKELGATWEGPLRSTRAEVRPISRRRAAREAYRCILLCAATCLLLLGTACSTQDAVEPHAEDNPAETELSRPAPNESANALDLSGGITNPDNGWLRGDLHIHSNYSEDALEQGGDWIAPSLRIAEYYEDPTFVEAFPQYLGNHLDFFALTDHRTAEGCLDPDFHSDKLVTICGEEFGGAGHAGALNINQTYSTDPTDGRSQNEQVQWTIDQVVAGGGLFSPNHPASDDDCWFWDVDGYESAEVWNTFWTLMAPPTPESVLDEQVANHGVENKFIRRAIRQEGQGLGGQYLAFYDSHLVAGQRIAAVGGGDRHMLVMPGHPTTYVQADEESPEGIIAGIRKGRTYVSRNPAGPQILFTAEAAGKSYQTGDSIAPGQTITLKARVARADQGRLRIMTGPIIRDITKEELLDIQWLSDVMREVPIEGDDFSWQAEWTPSEESWVYAIVLESIDYSDQPADVQAELDDLLRSMKWYGLRYGQLAAALLPFLDVSTVLVPKGCDPADWDVYRTVCVDVDDNYMGTIHYSDAIDKVLNVYREGDVLLDFSMGAITSAIMIENP